MDETYMMDAISKGKLSLAEAFKEIQTVKTAFQKAERIEQKLHFHDSVINELKSLVSSLASFEYVNLKLQDVNSKISQLINSKFEEFSSQYLHQLNDKVSVQDIESMLSQKVTWLAFNNFSQQMGLVKSKLEKHILSDFEGFKTKVKLELSKKANEKKPEEDFSADEMQQLKNRVTSLEQKYHDMFVEEGLDESDDYDSQEEMDNIMDDIDRAALRERGESDEFQEGEQLVENQVDSNRPEIPGTPTTAYTEVKTLPTPFTSPPNVPPEPVIEEEKQTPQEEPLPPKPELPKITMTEPQSLQKPEPKLINLPQFSEPPAERLKVETLQPQRPDDSPKSPSKVSNHRTIEIEGSEQPVAKYARTKGSSRNDNQTLSRKNSMVSSRSGTNAGAGPGNMRQINKKIAGLQKELEGYKQALEDSKLTLLDYQAELSRAYEKIGQVRGECQEIEERRQGMEISFIKALRRNGIERKKQGKAVAVAGINAKQMADIRSQIEEKGQSVVRIKTFVEKMAADTQNIKESQKNRINEVIQYMKYLDESRVQLSKEFGNILNTVKGLEKEMRSNIASVKNEISNIQGPIVDIISEQQRENQILSEGIRNNQSIINEVIEVSKINTPKGRYSGSPSHPATASPDLSMKYKLHSAKFGGRRTSANTCANWLEQIHDGISLNLPRIGAQTPYIGKKQML